MNSYFYLFEYPQDIIPEFLIEKQKEKPSLKDIKIFEEFNHLQKLCRKEQKSSELLLALKTVQIISYQPYVASLFIDIQNSGYLFVDSDNPKNSYQKSFNIKNASHLFKSISIKKKFKKKYKSIFFTMLSDKIYKKYKNTTNSTHLIKTYKNNLKALYQIYNYLEIGGTLFYSGANIILEDNISVNTFYLLSLLFEKILITHYYQRPHLICLGFLGEKRISKKQFEWIVNHCYNYQIEPKPSLKDVLDTFSFIISNQNKINKYFIKNQISKFIQKNFEFDLLTIYQFNHTTSYIKNLKQNYMEYFHYKINDLQLINILLPFDQKDVKMIHDRIGKEKVKNILQIGLSFGSFTFTLHEHFKKSHFTILDPKQESEWDSIGISFLEDKKVKYNFMESDLMTSFNQLIEEEKRYDCIVLLVDETYENLISFFVFMNTLLKQDGYLLLNSLSKPYLKLEDYIQKSLTFYNSVISQNNIYLYQKTI